MSEKPSYEELEQRIQELEQAVFKLDFPEEPKHYEGRMVVSGENETMTIVRNITESKRAEKALAESEGRYRSFVKNFQGIAFHGKMDFTPIFFHGAVEEITGYTEKELLDGKPRWDQTIHPDDLQSLFSEDEEKLHSIPHYSYEREYRIVRKDGTTRWVQEVIQNVCDNSGKPAILQGAIYDISERKRTENALQEAYRIINRSPAVAILWKNLEGWPVEFVSDNVFELFGYTAEEFTSGQVSYQKTVHPDDQGKVMKEVPDFSNDKERTSFEHTPYRIIARDGKVKWLDDRTYIRRDNKGIITHYEGIVVDITDSMQTAKVLRENKEKLARSKKMESLGLLAGGVAHDLNNALSGRHDTPQDHGGKP